MSGPALSARQGQNGVMQSDQSPLARELSEIEQSLIDIIWEPVDKALTSRGVEQWPVWDYVARTLYRKFPALPSAEAVLSGLPFLRHARWTGKDYGLVWRAEEGSSFDPQPGHRVGLTIAGLERVTTRGNTAGRLAKGLVEVISDIAKREDAFTPNPTMAVSGQVFMNDVASPLSAAPRTGDVTFHDLFIEECLLHETARITFGNSGLIALSGSWLRPYIPIRTAAEYVQRALDAAIRDAASEFTPAPLPLAQTLDYLALVISDLDVWPDSSRLVNAPDLESAAALSATASTPQEFEHCIQGLYNVISGLNVPFIPDDETKVPKSQQGTVVRLEHWCKRFTPDKDAKLAIVTATKQIRSALALRHLRAHSSNATRKQSVKALRALGLPDMTTDWLTTWETVKAKTAAALDEIRRELQVTGKRS